MRPTRWGVMGTKVSWNLPPMTLLTDGQVKRGSVATEVNTPEGLADGPALAVFMAVAAMADRCHTPSQR